MNTSVLTSTQLTDDRITFLGKTYGMLALCIVAATVATYFSIGMAFPYEHPWIMLFALIGGIFVVQAVSQKPGLNLIALLAFGALSGMVISPLVGMVAARSEGLVLQAFFTTAVTFSSLTAYVFISGKDFSFLKGFVWVGLVAIIVLALTNVFIFESPTLHLAISGMSVLLFSAFILYDTSNILRDYSNNQFVSAALTLYLDVFLLFQHLLSLFGLLGDE